MPVQYDQVLSLEAVYFLVLPTEICPSIAESLLVYQAIDEILACTLVLLLCESYSDLMSMAL